MRCNTCDRLSFASISMPASYGFSHLMIVVSGEKGKPAQTALGVAALPLNMTVEIELIGELDE